MLNLHVRPRKHSAVAGVPCQLRELVTAYQDVPHFALTDEHVHSFQRDGVVHLPGAFDASWVDYMRDAFTDAMKKPGPHAEFIGKGVTWDTMFERQANERDLEMFQDQMIDFISS